MHAKVFVTETNSFGCIQSDSMPVTVMTGPTPSLTGSNTGCLDNSSTYNYSSSLAANCDYSWSVNGGTILAYNGINSITVKWNNAGTNFISLTVVNTASGCDSTVMMPISVSSIAAPVIQPPVMSGCVPLKVDFTGNTPSPGQTYAWMFGDSFYSLAFNPSHTYTSAGSFTVTLITQNNTGCADTASGVVNVFESPDASFTHNYLGDTYFIDESKLILNNTSTGGSQYLWTFGTGDTANAFEPLYTYRTPGNYMITLTALNATGCKDIMQYPIEVRLRESFFVPNAFTPNGNDVNDYFSIKEENLATFNIKIFNRWGEVIYTSKDKDFKWDGTYNGSTVKQGIYGYTITTTSFNGDEHTFNGTITLMK